MQPEHRIDELIVDLSFTTTRLARHEKALLTDWLSEDLLPALDQLFSRYSPGQQVLRFETLEFDFGNLTSRNYQQSIRAQLLQKFSQLLQAQLLAVVPTQLGLSAHADGGDNSHAHLALTQLFNYLASGQLSAHQPLKQQLAPNRSEATTDTVFSLKQKDVANGTFIDPHHVKKISKPIVKQAALHEQLLDAVTAQHNIAELLRELPQREILIQRLLKQFSVSQRLELLRQLAPQQVQIAVVLLDLLQFFEINSINADKHRLDSHLVWQALLQLGLEYPQANTEFWLRHIFHTISTNAGMDEALLLQHLTAIKIPFGAAAAPLIDLQMQIAQLSVSQHSLTIKSSFADNYDDDPDSHYGAHQHISEQHNSKQSTLEHFNPEQLRQLIAAAFNRADASQLQQLWPLLIADESQLLLAALEHHLPQAEIRQQLMLRLPLVLQADIIALLAPALKATFLRLHSKASQLIEWLSAQKTLSFKVEITGATSKVAQLSEPSQELLLRQLWEIALGLIFKNQSAVVNTDYSIDSNDFVMCLAARYADLHNLDRNVVQQAFVSLLNESQINQQSLVNPVDLPERSTELHVNIAASNSHESRKPAEELFSDTAPGVSVESGYVSQKNIGPEKNIQTSNNFSSDVNSLSNISDHQLFDLCLRLKSGALAWASLANDVALLQRLISSYIRLGHSATAENCADFIDAIAAQAESSNAPSVFYLAVLQSLVADKLVDLEAIALGVQRNANLATIVAQPVQLDALALQLQQGQIQPEALKLTGDQLTKLIDIFIATETSIAPDIKAELITAVHQQVQHTNHKVDYYQSVLTLLVRKEMLDLTLVIKQVNQQRKPDQEILRNNPAKNVDDEKGNTAQPQRVVLIGEQPTDDLPLMAGPTMCSQPDSAEIIPARLTVHQQDIAQPTITQSTGAVITASNNIDAIVRALLAEAEPVRRLQTLQLDLEQWQSVVAKLIQQTQSNDKESIDKNSNVELIDAIQYQSRKVLDPENYYRLVIRAILQQQPIDLEAFATAAIDVKKLSPVHGEYKNISTNADSTITADNFIYRNTNQPDAGQFAVEESNAEEFNTTLLSANQIDTSQINASQFSSGNISPNDIHQNHVHTEQAMDYSLLTGSNNSLRKPSLSLALLLATEPPLNQEQLLALQQHINTLLNRPNQAIISEWKELLAIAQHAHVLIHSVPAHLLHQIAIRLQTGRYTWIDAVVKLVMEALSLLVADINSLSIKQAKWEFVFNYLFSSDAGNSNPAETGARALQLSIELCEQLAGAAGIDDVQRLVNLTQRRIALLKPPVQQKPAMRLRDITTNPATHSDATTPQWEAGLHISNAGQVLAAAFLPRLFSMLNLMQDGKFIHPGAADRAIHLVQFMVTGQSATPEYELILNKILCGISTSIPVSAGIEITEQEQTLIEQMLNSMIQHWKVLGSTSITGLRETFLQRQGWLVLEEDCWRLKVKEQTFDLLLDRLPWSISLIKHGWMDKPLRVSWRNHS